MTQGKQTGLAYAQIWTVDQSGYAKGQIATPDNVGTPPITSSAYLVRDPETFNFQMPSRVVQSWQGGDRYQGSRMFGIAGLDSFEFARSQLDDAFTALVEGSAVDATTNAKYPHSAPNVSLGNLPALGMMVSQYVKLRTPGQKGAGKWLHLILPRVQISYQGSQMASQAVNPNTYSVLPDIFDRHPNGMLLSAMNLSLEDDEGVCLYFWSDYPVAVTTWIANGVATTFTTPYVPATTAVGTATDTYNWFTRDGVAEVLTSITTAGVTTPDGGAGDSGDIGVLFYATEAFAAVS